LLGIVPPLSDYYYKC